MPSTRPRVVSTRQASRRVPWIDESIFAAFPSARDHNTVLLVFRSSGSFLLFNYATSTNFHQLFMLYAFKPPTTNAIGRSLPSGASRASRRPLNGQFLRPVLILPFAIYEQKPDIQSCGRQRAPRLICINQRVPQWERL